MIEKMKTVTIVCLKNDQADALAALRDLELMHIKPLVFQPSRKLADVQRELDTLTRLINLLSGKKRSAVPAETLTVNDLIHRVKDLNHTVVRSLEELDQLSRIEEQLEPWGHFDPALLTAIRDSGMDIRFCAAPANRLPEVPARAVRREINRVGDHVYFVIISGEALAGDYPEVTVSFDRSLDDVRRRKEELNETIRAADDALSRLAHAAGMLEKKRIDVLDEEEFLSTLARMNGEDRLTTLTGYIPARAEDRLKRAALENGWAYRITDPDPDDLDVPTLINTPKWLMMSRPLLNFVGITPGYREFDISAWFLVFFTLFFAIIVGDGGYGAIFLIATLFIGRKADPSAKIAVNLLFLLSFFTLVWGFLTGNFFGIDPGKLPRFMQGIAFFTGPDQQANTQFFCFLIGAIHLSIGHGIKLSAVLNSTMALAQIGWMAIIWGYFFLGSSLVTGSVFPDAARYLLISGAILVILFSVPVKNVVKAVGGGLGALLGSVVNSFVDVLSYIRLFAVGLSSYYVAVSFNNMGISIGSAGSGVAVIPLIGVGALVIVFGHTLNIALCGLSVLVHGIRLNTLEFSGHVGLEWAGIPFRAFRKRNG